ncbi:hypothetical protein Aros01_04753 [Streptosporangium roseum]|uniref:ABC-type sugar transport systems permease components-like protein n=2 Tax=Streptosporangium roseum TaxID=2001 RepID=D2BC53_STRRD|nr:ABC-type sugar transport systems permease components-like protein [Streptosporangium roseum DSM 43021]
MATAAVGRREGPHSGAGARRVRRNMTSYVMLLPFLTLFAGFVIWPLLNSLYLSLPTFNGVTPPEFAGLANTVLGWAGGDPVAWLATPGLTIPIMVLMATWSGMGYAMVIFVAGIHTIPEEYYEAARIDGATTWKQFRGITLPLLRPVTTYVVVTTMIAAFQVFEAVYIVFRQVSSVGGVLDSGLMIVPYLYDMGFTKFQLGYASAIAWALFLIIFVISMVQLRVGRATREL